MNSVLLFNQSLLVLITPVDLIQGFLIIPSCAHDMTSIPDSVNIRLNDNPLPPYARVLSISKRSHSSALKGA